MIEWEFGRGGEIPDPMGLYHNIQNRKKYFKQEEIKKEKVVINWKNKMLVVRTSYFLRVAGSSTNTHIHKITDQVKKKSK